MRGVEAMLLEMLCLVVNNGFVVGMSDGRATGTKRRRKRPFPFASCDRAIGGDQKETSALDPFWKLGPSQLSPTC